MQIPYDLEIFTAIRSLHHQVLNLEAAILKNTVYKVSDDPSLQKTRLDYLERRIESLERKPYPPTPF